MSSQVSTGFSELQPQHPLEYYYYLYKVAAFYNLSTGIVYGERQETRRYLSNF
jgi:hypothetical protein